MSRRITKITVEKIVEKLFDSDEVVQPQRDKPEVGYADFVSRGVKTKDTETNINIFFVEARQDEMLINPYSVYKETLKPNEALLSGVNHPVKPIIDTVEATINKEIVALDENAVTAPESDSRLGKLIGLVLEKLLELLDILIKKMIEEAAKKIVEGFFQILRFLLLLVALLIIYLL
jgi:hypothetical protein